MNAMTPQQRTKLHRDRKAAEAFSQEYLDGVVVATPEAFIEAKSAEACDKYLTSYIQFSYSLTNAFHDRLKAEHDIEDGLYTVLEMLDAWKYAEKEIRGE